MLSVRPGTFDDIIGFKVVLATIILAGAASQVASMALVYGWVRPPERWKAPLAMFHRWEGRTLVVLAIIIAALCVLDPGPQSAPDRQKFHTIFGIIVFVLLAAKISAIHFVPKAGSLLPILGLAVALSFGALWYTSSYAYWFEGQRGYSGHAEVDATVRIVDDPKTAGAYSPAEVHVKQGHAIEWENADAENHTVTAGKFDSGVRGLAKGETFRWQFNTPGTVEYRCTIHPEMRGRVIVDP